MNPTLSYLNHLQDLADKAAKEDQPTINFPLPTDPPPPSYHDVMEIKDIPNKGKGFYSKVDIKAGTFLIVSKPLGIIMGWEEDDFEDENSNEEGEDDDFYEEGINDEETSSRNQNMSGENDEDEEEDLEEANEDENSNSNEDLLQSNQRNGVLAIKIVKTIQQNPSLWFDKISNLYPRKCNMKSLPLWVCEDAKTGLEFELAVEELKAIPSFQKGNGEDIIEEIRQRLPFIIRYNCLSIETSPELFVYPDQSKGGTISLSATGLYYEPSYFNHSHEPNVSRWCIGDIMFFVINQDVSAGVELCISYIESELLCEDARTRSILLEMDFADCDDGTTKNMIDNDSNVNALNTQDEDLQGPVINLDVQDELMNMHPLYRLDEVNRLLRQSTGLCKDGDILDEDENGLVWYQCDTHRLRTLLALTYDSLGQCSKALNEWKKCVDFAQMKLPPADEYGIALCVQTALCAYSCGDEVVAKEYAKLALTNHDLLFGGGIEFFKLRYQYEMNLPLRQGKKALAGPKAFDILWSN